MTGTVASVKGFPGFGVYAASNSIALIRTHVAKRTEGQEYPGECAGSGADCHTDAGRSSHQGGEGDVRIPDRFQFRLESS
jgi:hypothetical protein